MEPHPYRCPLDPTRDLRLQFSESMLWRRTLALEIPRHASNSQGTRGLHGTRSDISLNVGALPSPQHGSYTPQSYDQQCSTEPRYGAYETTANRLPPTLLQNPSRTLQNRCLRNITGAYRRTPTAALEQETDTPPIDLYIDKVATQHAISTPEPTPRHTGDIYRGRRYLEIAYSPTRARHAPPRQATTGGDPARAGDPRPPGPMGGSPGARAEIREQQIRQRLATSECETQQRRQRTARRLRTKPPEKARHGPPTRALPRMGNSRWRHTASDKSATTWRAPWRPPATKEPTTTFSSETSKLPPYASSERRLSALRRACSTQ